MQVSFHEAQCTHLDKQFVAAAGSLLWKQLLVTGKDCPVGTDQDEELPDAQMLVSLGASAVTVSEHMVFLASTDGLMKIWPAHCLCKIFHSHVCLQWRSPGPWPYAYTSVHQ